jgi:hypothetical protein
MDVLAGGRLQHPPEEVRQEINRQLLRARMVFDFDRRSVRPALLVFRGNDVDVTEDDVDLAIQIAPRVATFLSSNADHLRQCLVCKRFHVAKRITRKFCSGRCRTAWSRRQR